MARKKKQNENLQSRLNRLEDTLGKLTEGSIE